MIHKYYEGTPQIINLSTEVGRLLGVVDATHLRKPQTDLRKKNKVKTIRASLAIEGNTLSEDQITAIIDYTRNVASHSTSTALFLRYPAAFLPVPAVLSF
jgi:Fic family protein